MVLLNEFAKFSTKARFAVAEDRLRVRAAVFGSLGHRGSEVICNPSSVGFGVDQTSTTRVIGVECDYLEPLISAPRIYQLFIVLMPRERASARAYPLGRSSGFRSCVIRPC